MKIFKPKLQNIFFYQQYVHFGKHTLIYCQGQLLEGVECHIYLYCFTFDDINLNRALVIIVLFPTKYSNKKVCANGLRKRKAL